MVNLAESAPNVYQEFQAGNFVVKETAGKFNQVSTDLALEHINRMCKTAGGLVGITQTKTALYRWMLTCCNRAQLVKDACMLIGHKTGEKSQTKMESTQNRLSRDEQDVQRIISKLREFNPFERDSEDLICISTNDVAPAEVKDDLLTVQEWDKQLLQQFIHNRFPENAPKQKSSMIKYPRANQRHSQICLQQHQQDKPLMSTFVKKVGICSGDF